MAYLDRLSKLHHERERNLQHVRDMENAHMQRLSSPKRSRVKMSTLNRLYEEHEENRLAKEQKRQEVLQEREIMERKQMQAAVRLSSPGRARADRAAREERLASPTRTADRLLQWAEGRDARLATSRKHAEADIDAQQHGKRHGTSKRSLELAGDRGIDDLLNWHANKQEKLQRAREDAKYERLTSPLPAGKARAKKRSPRPKKSQIAAGARVAVVDKTSAHFSRVGKVVKFNQSTAGVHVKFEDQTGAGNNRPRVLHAAAVEVLPKGSAGDERWQQLLHEWGLEDAELTERAFKDRFPAGAPQKRSTEYSPPPRSPQQPAAPTDFNKDSVVWKTTGQMAGYASMIAQVPLLEALSQGKQLRIAAILKSRECSQGENILTQGETDDSMYFLASGEAHVVINGEVKQTYRGPGSFFGLISLYYENAPSPATIRVCSVSATVLHLPRVGYEWLMETEDARGPMMEQIEQYQQWRVENGDASLARDEQNYAQVGLADTVETNATDVVGFGMPSDDDDEGMDLGNLSAFEAHIAQAVTSSPSRSKNPSATTPNDEGGRVGYATTPCEADTAAGIAQPTPPDAAELQIDAQALDTEEKQALGEQGADGLRVVDETAKVVADSVAPEAEPAMVTAEAEASKIVVAEEEVVPAPAQTPEMDMMAMFEDAFGDSAQTSYDDDDDDVVAQLEALMAAN